MSCLSLKYLIFKVSRMDIDLLILRYKGSQNEDFEAFRVEQSQTNGPLFAEMKDQLFKERVLKMKFLYERFFSKLLKEVQNEVFIVTFSFFQNKKYSVKKFETSLKPENNKRTIFCALKNDSLIRTWKMRTLRLF